MNEVITIILIISITSIILLLKIPFKLQFHGDALVLKGFYCIKFGIINLLCGRFLLNDRGDFVVENKSDNISKIDIKTSQFTRAFVKKLLQQISYKSLDVYLHFGVAGDNAKTAIVTACLQNLMNLICVIIKRNNIGFVCDSNIIMEMQKDALELTMQLKLSVSVLDVLISIWYGLLKKKVKI